jgi:hypothetical protein
MVAVQGYNETSLKTEPGEPKERLLKVVVGLGGNVVVLEVLLPVEHDALCLHFSILDVHLEWKHKILSPRYFLPENSGGFGTFWCGSGSRSNSGSDSFLD